MSVILSTSPAVQTIQSDGLFTLTFNVSVTSETLTGLDWSLDLTNCVLLSRDLSTTLFSDPVGTQLTGDLGASLQNVSAALPAPGTYEVMRGTFRVEDPSHVALVLPKPYLDLPGVVLGPPAFQEKAFTGFSGSTVLVPEPGDALFMGCILVVLCYAIFGGRKKD